MKKTLYSFYNVHLDCYDNPIATELTIDQIQENYRRSIVSAPDKAFDSFVHEKRLIQFGAWDDFDGTFELFDHPKTVCEMSKFFPSGYITKRIAQDEQSMRILQNAAGKLN